MNDLNAILHSLLVIRYLSDSNLSLNDIPDFLDIVWQSAVDGSFKTEPFSLLKAGLRNNTEDNPSEINKCLNVLIGTKYYGSSILDSK